MERLQVLLGTEDIKQMNYVTFNEYLNGQGIMSHVDASIFGPIIVTLSLLSDCVMRFDACSHTATHRIHLPRCSLLIITNDARYNWLHSISKEEVEILGDKKVVRGNRRISMIFRTVDENQLQQETVEGY